ncbi:MAG: galactokinase [Anaerolineae bacterium]|nr:galactokinase [Anaerolineae bacterium]
MEPSRAVLNSFQDRYAAPPRFLAHAPGRVNLIGEHTDYSDGFVLPMAIDRAVWIAFTPLPGRTVEVLSLDFNERLAFDLDTLKKDGPGWVEYIKGVAWALEQAGHSLGGWRGVVAGNVPVGAGLSSSAALELAAARAFASSSGLEWDAPKMALIGQQAENEWVGMRCGIMDQMISACGVQGHAVLIDCRSLHCQPAPLPAGTVVVVMDTATRRELVGSAYNERREQIEAAARYFGVVALRDVTRMRLENYLHDLDDLTGKRAHHVITENQRVLEAVQAMQAGDAGAFGRLMNESHASLRDDFEVSSLALDAIVECAQGHPACYGARMTGAGFGGCAVALVRADAVDRFSADVARQYTERTGLEPQMIICRASAGASVSVLT